MTTFLLACAGLVLLSAVFVLFSPARPGTSEEDLDKANLEWYARRSEELRESGEGELEEDARLRLLEEARSRETVEKKTARPFPTWVLVPLVAVVTAVIYYRLGAAEDVLIAERLREMSADTSPEAMLALVKDVEARSAQRPGNLHYQALLGRYYMGEQAYDKAVEVYSALLAGAPEDPQVLAYTAQAEFLAAGRRLTDTARLHAEQALAVDPHQRTALGLLGMASFEAENYPEAIRYWERLLAMEPPGSEGAQMIAGVIQSARQQLGQEGPGTAPVMAQSAEPGATALGITVSVALPEGADISPDDTVFVLARAAESSSRMPIAVQRFSAAQLPLTLRLDDSNSMAGQKLSETPAVIVAVQVSPDGRPGEATASYLGQAGPLSPAESPEPVTIVITPNPGSVNAPE